MPVSKVRAYLGTLIFLIPYNRQYLIIFLGRRQLISVSLILLRFSVDNWNMEVIDCFEISGRPRVRKPRAKAVALNSKRQVKRNPVFSYGNDGFEKSKISLASVLRNIKANCILLCKNVRQSAKIMLVVPATVLLCVVPYGVSKIISWQNSFVHQLDMTSSVNSEAELLDGAMTEFAFGKTSYYDSDGNIFDEDSVKLVSSAKNLKQAVSFQNYTVKAGDTISGICQKFGLSNISTLIAVNNIGNVRSVYTGQKLKVPSADGLIHTVAKNESIGSIAKKYNASVTDIIDTNDLSSEVLIEGTSLFIPGARLDSNTLQKAMGEIFTNPLKCKYRITSRFGYRLDPITGVASTHKGVDLACPTGTPIYAARSGKVLKSSFSPLYGNYVVIEHVDGYQTLYAHMSKSLAKKGDRVSQGTKIGLVGSTGYSTGAHLHLTVYKNSKPIDPFTVLK